jgi:hypothetical protein
VQDLDQETEVMTNIHGIANAVMVQARTSPGAPTPIIDLASLADLVGPQDLFPREEDAKTFLAVVRAFGYSQYDRETIANLFFEWQDVIERDADPALLEAKLNTRNGEGFTPLHQAIRLGTYGALRFILDHVCPDLTVTVEATPSLFSDRLLDERSIGQPIPRKFKEIITHDYDHLHSDQNVLTMAIACCAGQATIELLVASSKDRSLLKAKDGRGETPLTTAIKCHNMDCANWLIVMDPEICRLPNGTGERPLELAVRSGNAAIVTRIIEQGYQSLLDDKAAQAEIANAVWELAWNWPVLLTNRDAIFGSFFKNYGAICPVQHCVKILFDEAIKPIRSCEAVPDETGPTNVSQLRLACPDASLMRALFDKKAHIYLLDQGAGLLAWAKEQKNDVLIGLCNGAGIG